MKEKQKNCKGFTLLELLVVVVIIGILAAVALPQYQVATKVAKIKALYPVMRALVEARTNYYLMHNTRTTNMDDLDIDVPYNRKGGNTYFTDWGWFVLSNDSDVVGYRVNNTDVDIEFKYGHYSFTYGAWNQGVCVVDANNARANKICEKLGGVYKNVIAGRNVYLFY